MEAADHPPPTPQTPERVLRRSRDDRMIGGVCGGLGRYLGLDPTLVRIGFVALTVLGGSGVLAYIIAWLVIPDQRPGEAVVAGSSSVGTSGSVLVGGLLVAAGTVLLLDQVIPGFRQVLGPLVLIAIGLAMLATVRR
jgi:phage shock protein C